MLDVRSWKICSKDIISTKEQLISQLLKNRGIKTAKQKELFFNPKLSDYKQELNISGIEKAKKRILKAIENKEQMIVYGDYDVDGLCSSAIVYLALSSLGARITPYIPHREKEGYGLSKEGLKAVKDSGASLVITVDNGIVALEQSKYAKELNLDLIITDHHTPKEKLPDALSIVYSTVMAGAGVAWSLMRSLVPGQADDLLDLVALATICDLVPLSGVNRCLTKTGLEVLNKKSRVGLRELYQECAITGPLTSYHVGHLIGPRLNALGRMEHSIDALRLLCTKDREKAKVLARRLCDTNDQKKQLTQDAISQAKLLVTQEIINKKIIILQSENWIPGIIGLIAGRITDEYKVPAIIISKGEVYSKASARSIDGLNIVEIIRSCGDIFEDLGGHPKAAGFTIKSLNIKLFEEKIIDLIKDVKLDTQTGLGIDGYIDVKKVTKSWVDSLATFEPFGIDNPKPLLAVKGVKVSEVRTVGDGQHLRFKVDGITAIGFRFGEMVNKIKEADKVDLAFYLEIDNFNGYENLQLKVVDIVC